MMRRTGANKIPNDDPGAADGSATTKTIIAVSKFEAERYMEVTGEIMPEQQQAEVQVTRNYVEPYR